MTNLQFTAPTFFVLQAAVWLGGGALIGAAYFLTLRWNVGLLTLGRAPLFAAAVQIGRFLLLAGVLAAIADFCGAPPLISVLAGIQTARALVTMRPGVSA